MHKGIRVQVEAKDSDWSLQEVLEDFCDLSRGISAQCRGNAGSWLKRFYISEIDSDEHMVMDDGFTIFFNNPSGMCSASSGVTLHMAQLLLAHNQKQFEKRLERIGYSLVTDFGTVEKIQSEAEALYFDHDGVMYGIHLPVTDFNEIDKHFITDSGYEITFDNLPKSKQKLIRTMIEEKKCQSPVSKKIHKGTLKPMTFI